MLKILAILILALTPAYAESLIQNGSFENGAQHWSNWRPPGLPTGYVFDISADYDKYGIEQAPEGSFFAEVDHESNFSQTVSTHPGESYKLRFAIGRRGNLNHDRWFRVLINGREVFEKLVNKETIEHGFAYEELTYTAQLEETTISFYVYGKTGNPTHGVLLDDISFTHNLKYKFDEKQIHLITGKIIDHATEQPLKALVNYTLNTSTKGYTWSDPLNGNFQLATLNPFQISLSIYLRGYQPYTNQYTYHEMKDQVLEIRLRPVEKTVLKNVLFDQSSANLKQSSYYTLDSLASFLLEHPDIKIKLTGHTENTGSRDANLKLSEKRAQEVQKYLSNQGVSNKRILIEGKGSSEPLAENNTPENQALNRRVELEIIE
ncbi:OmpA family protein [Cytophagaceae bacterium ABcell3]|nr:OmpA family protein [Cytophagaceae bacterium ABcell3]